MSIDSLPWFRFLLLFPSISLCSEHLFYLFFSDAIVLSKEAFHRTMSHQALAVIKYFCFQKPLAVFLCPSPRASNPVPTETGVTLNYQVSLSAPFRATRLWSPCVGSQHISAREWRLWRGHRPGWLNRIQYSAASLTSKNLMGEIPDLLEVNGNFGTSFSRVRTSPDRSPSLLHHRCARIRLSLWLHHTTAWEPFIDSSGIAPRSR